MRKKPFIAPCFFRAQKQYSEHVGVNLQDFGPSIGLMILYANERMSIAFERNKAILSLFGFIIINPGFKPQFFQFFGGLFAGFKFVARQRVNYNASAILKRAL